MVLFMRNYQFGELYLQDKILTMKFLVILYVVLVALIAIATAHGCGRPGAGAGGSGAGKEDKQEDGGIDLGLSAGGGHGAQKEDCADGIGVLGLQKSPFGKESGWIKI